MEKDMELFLIFLITLLNKKINEKFYCKLLKFGIFYFLHYYIFIKINNLKSLKREKT